MTEGQRVADSCRKEGNPKDQDFYFNFYSSLQNQSVLSRSCFMIMATMLVLMGNRANMIGDTARTGTYRKAILGNAEVAFKDKVVLDVGAGELIRSLSRKSRGADGGRLGYPVLSLRSGWSAACRRSRGVLNGGEDCSCELVYMRFLSRIGNGIGTGLT